MTCRADQRGACGSAHDRRRHGPAHGGRGAGLAGWARRCRCSSRRCGRPHYAVLTLAACRCWRRGVCLAATRRRRGACCCACAGACAAGLSAAPAGAPTCGWPIAAGCAGGPRHLVTGVVAGCRSSGRTGVRFVFRGRAGRRSTGSACRGAARIALGWYRGCHEDALIASPEQELARRPALALHGAAAPAARQRSTRTASTSSCGCSSKAFAPPATCAPRQGRGRSWPTAPRTRSNALRQRVRDAITLHVADARAAGVLAALAVGDQAAIERDDWELFRTTGIAHLMSHQRPARDDVRLAGRRAGRLAVAAQRAR